MNGAVGVVAMSLEITNCEGSRPFRIMARSTEGSRRMNSAENPPTVDCRMIDMVGACFSWSAAGLGGFKPSWRIGRAKIASSVRELARGQGVVKHVGIDDLAGRSQP